jgi:GR25 family glycosyltransferase involved in LPS biosynthesis
MDIFNQVFLTKKQIQNTHAIKFKQWVDQIYYINLDTRPDRNKHIQLQLYRHNLSANRLTAIRGNKGHDAMVACKKSHQSIIETARNLKHNNICVLEDDVIFDDNFLNMADICVSNIPDDWDLLFLGHCFSKPYTEAISRMIYRPINIFCTHCYCVHKKAYDTIIEYLSNTKYLYMPIDHIYNYLHQKHILNMYMCYPSIANQIPNISDIGQGPNSSNNFIV